MRHCEENALTCTIVIIHEFDRGEIEYRGGEIARVALNGVTDEDRIVDMVRLEDARFMVRAPPLDVGVDGWPVVRGDPTAPFRIEHLASRPPARRPVGAATGASSPPLPGAPPEAASPPPPPGSAPTAKSPRPPPLPGAPPPLPRAKFREALDEPATAEPNAPTPLREVSRSAPVALETSGMLEDVDERDSEESGEEAFLEDVLEPKEASSLADVPALALVPANPEVSWVTRPPPSPYSDFKKKSRPRASRRRPPHRRKSWLRRIIARFFDRLPI
jgi:hypothetical protein